MRGAQVETRPIKGTRRRPPIRSRTVPCRGARGEPQDRAENVMIVDLLRNDLGKTCATGSIQVPGLFEIESYARVHHLVSTSAAPAARLRAARRAARLLPGRSSPGAQAARDGIIEELEPTRRSVLRALGYVGHDGQMDTNIAIRTLLHSGGRLYCWAAAAS